MLARFAGEISFVCICLSIVLFNGAVSAPLVNIELWSDSKRLIESVWSEEVRLF
jgi:hypothetical protein